MEIKYQFSVGKLIPGDEATSPVSIFVNPDQEERRYLTTTLKLDEHTLASALDPDEVARLEFEPEHQALISTAVADAVENFCASPPPRSRSRMAGRPRD